MFINYKLADGTTALVEVTEEVADFIINDDRLTSNADRRERYHCPYHIDALGFEGMEYAYTAVSPRKTNSRAKATALLIKKKCFKSMPKRTDSETHSSSWMTDTAVRTLIARIGSDSAE